MEELPGDDLFGLQAAFFAAGAKRIVCSLWPVQSWIAPPIMTRFHGNLLAGQPPELALRDAVIGYVRDRGLPHLERYYWAPIFLSAVGRPAVEGTAHGQRGRT
jgi:CHAT domain-containing protein